MIISYLTFRLGHVTDQNECYVIKFKLKCSLTQFKLKFVNSI